jgi:hypothetical protein
MCCDCGGYSCGANVPDDVAREANGFDGGVGVEERGNGFGSGISDFIVAELD